MILDVVHVEMLILLVIIALVSLVLHLEEDVSWYNYIQKEKYVRVRKWISYILFAVAFVALMCFVGLFVVGLFNPDYVMSFVYCNN